MKRNRIITAILIMCTSLMLAFGFVGCAEKGCEHTYAVTIYDIGYHYQKCSVCCAPNEESKERHKDENADTVCDICSFGLSYVYDEDTESYVVYTKNGLRAAFALGGNVVLGNDVELTNTVTAFTDLTLDLNGKTLTNADSFTEIYFIVVASGTLTVADSQDGGKMEATTDTAIFVKDSGTLIVNGGSINAESYPVYVYGIATVNDGVISQRFVASDNSNVSVTGGTFNELSAYKSNVSVSGGTFNGYVNLQGGNATISSGTFNVNLSVNEGSATGIISGGTFNGLSICDGSVTVTNGAFSNVNMERGSVTISGGTVNELFAYESNVSVGGGTVNELLAYESNVSVGGGSFCFDPTQYVNVELYDVTYSDGIWTVVQKNQI